MKTVSLAYDIDSQLAHLEEGELKVKEVTRLVKEEYSKLEKIRSQVNLVLVGQKNMMDNLLIALLSRGHILLEGVPGLAKTLAVKSLASVIDATFRRIQFTPDLLPADLIGTKIYNQKLCEFSTEKGPVFANFILADEINRAPAKVQSALLECMQEKQVTIGKETFTLPEPFLVLATQNPIESEGTYTLPEAQIDRFMLKVVVGYPNKEEELEIIERMTIGSRFNLEKVIEPEDILRLQRITDYIYVSEKIKKYIVDLVFATRNPASVGLNLGHFIEYGGSPRASIYLTIAAKAMAFLRGRGYVVPADVKEISFDVLRHRIILSYEAEAEEVTTDNLISEILKVVKVP